MKKEFFCSVIIAIVCLVGGVFIGFFLSNSKNDNTDNDFNNKNTLNESVNDIKEQDSNDNSKKDTEVTEWVNYLLKQNINKSYIRVWDEDNRGNFYENNINITKKELEDILVEFTKGNIKKIYYSGMGDSTPDIIINYTTNTNEEYTLEIKYGLDIVSDNWDRELIKKLELENYDIEGKYDQYNPYFSYTSDWDAEIYLDQFID